MELLVTALALGALAAATTEEQASERWVRLVDQRTGAPLADAEVRGRSTAFSRRAAASRTTGPDGSVRLLRRAEMYVAEADGYGPLTFLPELAGPSRDSAAVLELREGARLDVRVFGVDGRPVTDATVHVSCAAYSVLERSPVTRFVNGLRWSASVDEGGVARLVDLPAEARLIARVNSPGAAPRGRAEIDDRLVLEAGEHRILEAHVGVARTVEGRALYDDGTPAAGLELTFRPRAVGSPRLHAGRETVQADATGRFRFDDVPAGVIWVGAAPKVGAAPATPYEVRPVGDMAPLELVVPRTAQLTGQVLDAEGHGLEGVHVSAAGGLSSLATRTGPSGRFALEHLSPGPYRIRAQHNGVGYAAVIARPGDADVTLRLKPAGALAGVVVDETGAEVGYDELEVFGERHHSGSSGSWGSHFASADLVPGDYNVVAVCADGRVGVSSPIEVSASHVAEAQPIVLRPGGLVTVRSRSHSGYAAVRCKWDGLDVAGDNLLAGTRATFALPAGQVVVELQGATETRTQTVTIVAGRESNVTFE